MINLCNLPHLIAIPDHALIHLNLTKTFLLQLMKITKYKSDNMLNYRLSQFIFVHCYLQYVLMRHTLVKYLQNNY